MLQPVQQLVQLSTATRPYDWEEPATAQVLRTDVNGEIFIKTHHFLQYSHLQNFSWKLAHTPCLLLPRHTLHLITSLPRKGKYL